MKHVLKISLAASLLLSFLWLTGCDDLVEDLTSQTVNVDEPIGDKNLSAQPSQIDLTNRAEFKKSAAKMAKAFAQDFVEIPVGATDLAAFSAVLLSGLDAGLSCTLQNNGSDLV